MHRLLAVPALIFCLFVSARAQNLPSTAQSLLEQARAASPARYQYAMDQGVRILPTTDGRSFALYWATKPNQPLIVTLHGSASWAFDEFFLWHAEAANAGYGILALQWWQGTDDSVQAYYSPAEIHRELRAVLQQQGVVEGTAMLHGFSRGSANLYGVAALDRQSRDRYYGMFLANAGGASPDFPPNLDITNGTYGYNVFSGTYWTMFCGGLDPNPDRDGCPAMHRTSDWIGKFGGVTDLFIEDSQSGHGGLQQSQPMVRSVLKNFSRMVSLRSNTFLSKSAWDVIRDPRFEIAGASTPNVGSIGSDTWLIVNTPGGRLLYRSPDGSNASTPEIIPGLETALAGTGMNLGEVVPRADAGGSPVLYVLALAPPGTNRTAVYRMMQTSGTFTRNPQTPVFTGAPDEQQFLGVPDITRTADGGLRLTYVARGAAPSNARSAISYDGGASFQPEFPNLFGDLALPAPLPTDINVDPAILKLKTGGYLAVTMRGARLFLFTSVDGRTFIPTAQDAIEPETLAPGATGLFDPTLVELVDGRIFLYATAGTTPDGSGKVVRAQLIRRAPKITQRNTLLLPPGTGRAEIGATSFGDLIVTVAESQGQVRHRAYLYSANGQQIGDPVPLTSVTEEFGEPADLRAAVVDDQLLLVYRSIGKDESLLFARLALDGSEFIRKPIAAHVGSRDQEDFTDLSVVWRGDSLLVSTGIASAIRIRRVDKSGNVLDVFSLPTFADGFPTTTGNTMVNDGDRLWLTSAPAGSLMAIRLNAAMQPDSSVFLQDATREQRLSVTSLSAFGWFLLGDEARSRGSQDSFAPYLKVFSADMALLSDFAMADNGSRPALARRGSRLFFAYTTAAQQVRVDEYSIE